MRRYFELSDAKSSKFWEINVSGKRITVRYGKIGTDGQTTSKEIATPAEAKAQADKLIMEKTKKGYFEGGTPSSKTLEGAGSPDSTKNKRGKSNNKKLPAANSPKKDELEEPDMAKKNKELKVFIDHNKSAYADCIKWLHRKSIKKCTPFLNLIRCELNRNEYSFLELQKNDFSDAKIFNFEPICGNVKDEYYLCYVLEFKVILDDYENFKKALRYSKNFVEVVLGFKDEKGGILEDCYEPITDCPVKFEF